MSKKVKQNMGTIDKFIRIIIAVIFVVLYFTNAIQGVLGIILVIFAIIFLLTSIISRCPLYIPFKISTIKKKKVD